MDSLYDLALKACVTHNLPIGRIQHVDHLTQDLKQIEPELRCQKTANSIIELEEAQEEEWGIGYTDGLMEVLQHKQYCQINYANYLRSGCHRQTVCPSHALVTFYEPSLAGNHYESRFGS